MTRAFRQGTCLLLAMFAGCSNAKPEAASLVSAVDRFRRAENVQKPAEFLVLVNTPCRDLEVCEAKDACVAFAAPTADALKLKSEVERGLADLEAKRLSPEDPIAQGLRPKLEESAKLLEQGHRALDACDERTMRLRRKYSL